MQGTVEPKGEGAVKPVACNTYRVMSDAVERGVAYGWQRAHKHTDKPDETAILSAIEEAVTNEMCEYFWFSVAPDES